MTEANWMEKAVLNNFIWAAVQKKRIVPLWRTMVELPEGAVLSEVGCGRGAGSIILFDEFKPARIDAFDVDEDMVRKAKKLVKGEFGGKISVSVGDVTKMSAGDGTYDGVFDFFSLHHVEDWYAGVSEISRVLKPGGHFAFAEVYVASASRNILFRNVFRHPAGNRFERDDLIRALAENGLRIMEKRSNLGGYGIVGVARKNPQ